MSGALTAPDIRANRVAAQATGVGVGLLVFMVVWTFGSQVTTHMWGPPSGALVAMGIALLMGVVATITTWRRLVRTQRQEDTPPNAA